MFACLPLTSYHTHQRNLIIQFLFIALEQQSQSQERKQRKESENERENTDNTNKAPTYVCTHNHTHSHPPSKLWRNLGLALVFTTKVQWSIAKPKKKLMRECVCEREQTKRAPRLLRMLLGRGRSLALCRTHASHVETSTRRQTERVGEREW